MTVELSPFGVSATSGTLRQDRADGDVVLPHTWTPDGVTAGPASNGAQVFHLSVALCVLNDTYREAQRLGIEVRGVEVTADGGFDEGWGSTGVTYAVTVDSAASEHELADLLATVDAVAEIPRAIRAGADVRRT